jgi:hypothetical protein
MASITQFGQATYLTYSREELEHLGLVVNPNMYIGSGWRFCVTCKRYAYVNAMSHPGKSDCFEVCRDCNTHSRRADNPITKEN